MSSFVSRLTLPMWYVAVLIALPTAVYGSNSQAQSNRIQLSNCGQVFSGPKGYSGRATDIELWQTYQNRFKRRGDLDFRVPQWQVNNLARIVEQARRRLQDFKTQSLPEGLDTRAFQELIDKSERLLKSGITYKQTILHSFALAAFAAGKELREDEWIFNRSTIRDVFKMAEAAASDGHFFIFLTTSKGGLKESTILRIEAAPLLPVEFSLSPKEPSFNTFQFLAHDFSHGYNTWNGFRLAHSISGIDIPKSRSGFDRWIRRRHELLQGFYDQLESLEKADPKSAKRIYDFLFSNQHESSYWTFEQLAQNIPFEQWILPEGGVDPASAWYKKHYPKPPRF